MKDQTDGSYASSSGRGSDTDLLMMSGGPDDLYLAELWLRSSNARPAGSAVL